ncbi:hypothetical protein N7462_002152 [Penicillium macrosclerotiorum]|uniref:uncharacterized protein n=1 Tax=Penicillium macrosclerotiorum TaxID=303699 RepID=UPI00254784BF|nr:uncharacterized protein N7462_002152 [Penicillium macrosclerotiorum]KAJ5692729.1 hypothetical protein N7462_002152 [Penicillium macrosclerotiorum]
MDWYCQLTDRLLNQENIEVGSQSYQNVFNELEGTVVALYKALLLYQMKSVCSYYKNQGLVFLRNTINLDDWDGELEAIKSSEEAVQKDTDQYCTLYSKDALGTLVKQSQEEQKILGDFHQTLQDYILAQKNIHRDEQDSKDLRDIFVGDPQGVMEIIQRKNDKLLRAAYEWILDTPEYQKFTNWSDPDSCRVLCLTGPAGTGKSMLTIGILSELARQPPWRVILLLSGIATQHDQPDGCPALVDLDASNLIQQPHLLSYLRETLRNAGASYFDTPANFWPLAEIFKQMLADKDMSPVYLTLDALDECDDHVGGPRIQHVISLISETLSVSKKVKWLVSSRPEINLVNVLLRKEASGAVVGVNVYSRPEPVNAYIKHKLAELENEHNYAQDILDDMSNEIRKRAQNTFLWVSLVFKDIIENDLPDYEAIDHIKASPPSLKSLYDRLMAKIQSITANDREYCGAVMAASCFAYRPLAYAELHILAGLHPRASPDRFLRICGSFLTVENGIIHVIHNSTREYLNEFFSATPGGIGQCHLDMSKRSIGVMSQKLKRNMYGLEPGVESQDIIAPENDPLAPLGYSCEFWAQHLCQSGDKLTDAGEVLGFLEMHLFHWFESLSLKSKLPSAIPSIRDLLKKAELCGLISVRCFITNKLQVTSNESAQLINLLKDADRFALKNLSVMEQAPLQIYGTALILSPLASQIRARHWEERFDFIKDIKGVARSWDPCLMTLDTPQGLGAIKFSPQ